MDVSFSVCLERSVDFIAASFVRKGEDVREIRAVLAAAAAREPQVPQAGEHEWGGNLATGIRIIAKARIESDRIESNRIGSNHRF